MPRTLLRFFAVLLLALAIPAQGTAAVTAGVCMALGEHHGAAAQASHEHAQDAQAMHDEAAHSHSDPSASPSLDDKSQGERGHCGPCVACCASASIAPSMATASRSARHAAVDQLPHPFLAGIQPDEFDRPPLAL
jgi:hypothetical protein